MHTLSKLGKLTKWLAIGLIILAIVIAISAKIKHYQRFKDNNEYRGADIVNNSQFLDNYQKIYPSPDFKNWETSKNWQGWSPAQSMWYYNATQGSDLLPYDFFLSLEQPNSQSLFRDNQHIDQFRYIPQQKTKLNPDALPLGMVKDEYQNKSYLGFTCAACHTSQIVYQDTAIRIDGGPAMANMDGFMRELEVALSMTLNSAEKQQRFVERVLALDINYDSKTAIVKDLAFYQLQISLYNYINTSDTQYGYARLDAFGRIYNRVLQHVINKKQLTAVIEQSFDAEMAAQLKQQLAQQLISSTDMVHLFDKLVSTFHLTAHNNQLPQDLAKLKTLKQALFNQPDAPVSYPFLWDIAQHDYVQWNGIAANSGVGAIGRNSGEVMGVFATLDWQETDRSSLATWIGGQSKQNENGKLINFRSSIDVDNLRLLESQLAELTSPKWPETVLPKIDQKKAKLGKKLFNQHCQSCHQNIERDNPSRKIVAQMTQLDNIKTDPKMALNGATYQGKSGILEGIYLSTDVGNILIQEEAAVASILTSATKNVVATPDPDKWAPTRFFNWIYNLMVTAFDNTIKSSVKRGDYQPDTTQNPYASLLAYKARPLNGIWATAPYLHNGSVPSLYDLLLPKCEADNDIQTQCRPNQFTVGSRYYDPKKVGFISSGYLGFEFKTDKVANSNAGHNYATTQLSDPQRWQLVEYMKTL